MTLSAPWHQVDALFQQALEVEPEQRANFLARVSGDDPELRAAVEALLRASDESGDFLETPVEVACDLPWEDMFAAADSSGGVAPAQGELDRSGELVGPYRLLRQLGHGGMATVYLAERADGQWEQEVALKVIRRGLDTEDVVRRFLGERQILSSLNHPSIARFYDGGTTADHLPYLVIEHVVGTPITEYCDEHALSVDDRLTLFCDVGRAVAHAHRGLVVHRDLKPSNILVDDEGHVKLLDFGIAKLLDPAEEGDRTRTGFQPLTPDYASPEQVSGDPITTASDVYQLGMLLCELLSGSRPYEVRALSPARMEQLIATAEPGMPSAIVSSEAATSRAESAESLARRLRGDLDTIVLKALRKEPERRYPSAEAMIADIERHVAGLPVAARPDTLRYRFGKLLRRRPWLGPAAAVLLLVAGGYVFTLERNARELERERNVARAEAERAQEVQGFLSDLFRSADPFAPADPERGRLITVQEALGIGSARVRTELADRPALRASLLGTISSVYSKLDQLDSARALREESLVLERTQRGEGSPEAAAGMLELGQLLVALGERDSAEVVLHSGLAVTRRLGGASDTLAAAFLIEIGILERDRGAFTEAEARTQEAIEILRSAETGTTEKLIGAYQSLAETHSLVDDVEAAREAAAEALRLAREAFGDEHPRTAIMMIQFADALDWAARDEEAVELYRPAIAILQESLGPTHMQTLLARNNLAITLGQLGDHEAAEAELRRVLEGYRSKDAVKTEEMANTMQNLAVHLSAQGKYEEAEEVLLETHDLYVSALEPGHYLTAFPLLTLAGNQLALSQFGPAEETAQRAVAILREALPPGHYGTTMAECRWGRALASLGRRSEAKPLLETSAATLESSERASAEHRLECMRALADLYESDGDAAAAAGVRERIARLEAAGG